MRTVEREVVGVVILSKDKKVLLTRKNSKRDEVYPGLWIVPGGGIEGGEKGEQALIRETKEELGIDISCYEIKLVDDEGTGESPRSLNGERILCKMRFFDYLVNIDDKNSDEIKIVLDDELEAYTWVKPEDLKNYKLSPPTERLFKKLYYF